MWEKKEQSAAHIRISPGKRRNSGACMGEKGYKDGEKAETEDATAWDKL
jgi:hypothetical protein